MAQALASFPSGSTGRWLTSFHHFQGVPSERTENLSAMQCNAMQCDAMRYDTIQYNTIQYNTIQYNTIQYNTIQYNTIQYNTIQYNTPPTTVVDVKGGLVVRN